MTEADTPSGTRVWPFVGHLILLSLTEKTTAALQRAIGLGGEDPLLFRCWRQEFPQDADMHQALAALHGAAPRPDLRVALVMDSVPDGEDTPESSAASGLRERLTPAVDLWIRVVDTATGQGQESLRYVAQAITDTLQRPGLLGVDHTDFYRYRRQGAARAAVATAQGPARAQQATRQAVTQLLAAGPVAQARHVFVCVTSGLDLAEGELDTVDAVLAEVFSGPTDLLSAHVFEPELNAGHLRVVVMATGFSR
jgi:hypothetical protein